MIQSGRGRRTQSDYTVSKADTDDNRLIIYGKGTKESLDNDIL